MPEKCRCVKSHVSGLPGNTGAEIKKGGIGSSKVQEKAKDGKKKEVSLKIFTMTPETTCLVDERGIEILVTWERDGHKVILHSVEVVIAGRGIDITNSLNDSQYQTILEEIFYSAVV